MQNLRISCSLRVSVFVLALSAVLSGACASARAQAVPPFVDLVNDQAQMLPQATRAYLKYTLKEYQARTGHQLAFLSVDNLGGFAPEVYALKVAESWKLGRARPDDGLLLLVAKQDRKVRIEVGYGLEGAIPDAVANRVIDEILTPAFRGDQFAWGIVVAMKMLMRHADAGTEDGTDPLAVLLAIDAPALKSYINDHAQILESSETQRLDAKLRKLAAESGLTFGLLTVPCPGQAPLERCVDVVNELWSGSFNLYDGLVTWFVHRGAADGGMRTARLTLDRLPAAPKQPWRKGALDQHAELESALGELVQRAGLIWTAPPPPPPHPAAHFSPRAASSRNRPFTFEERLTLGVLALTVLGGLGLFYLMTRHSKLSPSPPSAEPDRWQRDSRDSSPEPYHGRGGGWSWGSSGDSGAGSSSEGGGGGSFGGGGASGSW